MPSGALWGIGHSITILLVGGAIILFRVGIPPRIGLAMEFAVAVMLIVLGAFNLSGRQIANARSSARPVIVGFVHGLAGSAFVALLVVAAVPGPWLGLLYLALFGIGTIAGMGLITMAIAMPSALTARRFVHMQRYLRLASGLASVGFGLLLDAERDRRRPLLRRAALESALSRKAAASSLTVDARIASEFGRRLRAWYRRNARDLPWRKTRDAYHVLVSELMLQQTQVSRVVDYYGEFLDRFPTLARRRARQAGASDRSVGRTWLLRPRAKSPQARQSSDGQRPVAGQHASARRESSCARCRALERTPPARCRALRMSGARRWSTRTSRACSSGCSRPGTQ